MTSRTLTAKGEKRAVQLSLFLGILLLGIKIFVFSLTRSSAAFADLFEGGCHLLVVLFATFSLSFAQKPADKEHHYGHDRIAFFSAGFEGGMILFAAVAIFQQLFTHRSPTENLQEGVLLVSLSFLLNGALALYLMRFENLILQANGKHLLTDCLTSGGVLIALLLPFLDQAIAALIALNILWTALRLLRKAFDGLMDRADPKIDKKLHALMKAEADRHAIEFHQLRHRLMGNSLQVDVHLLFPKGLTLFKAHHIATEIEREVVGSFLQPVDFVSHIEPSEDHDNYHKQILGHNG
ncbi:MAG: cation transporter [Chlamydiales bacterium]|nr:cation transporter [Chlamydiales bacterium]